MTTARVAGVGSYLPKRVVTNEDLKTMVKNFDEERANSSFEEWAEGVTGIRERRYVTEETAEEMGAAAAREALAAAAMKETDIDFIIASSFTPERTIPNLAVSIANLLGIPKTGGFPLNTACAGFIYGLSMAYALIRSDIYRNILVVATEVLSKVTDFKDPTTAILFGDGAGAAILQPASSGGITSAPHLSSDFSGHIQLLTRSSDILTQGEIDYLRCSFIKMPGGPSVLRKAVNSMAQAALKALEASPYNLEDIDYLIPHQANQRITVSLADKLKFPREKVVNTIKICGNTSGASVAIALDLAVKGKVKDCRIERGDKVLLTAVGGGYSLAGAVLEY